MTREEAIEVLKINIPHYGDDSAEWDLCLEAVDIAIRSIEMDVMNKQMKEVEE